MAEAATGMKAYVALMKPRVLVLLQITALCAVLIHDAQIWRETGEWNLLHTGQVMIVVIVGGMLTAVVPMQSTCGMIVISIQHETNCDRRSLLGL